MSNSERKDYYEILGVDPSTNVKLVKNIYLQLVHKIKEEGDESPEAQERLKLIEEAYEVLSDPQKRVEYESPGQVYVPETDAGFDKQSTSRSTSLRSRRTLPRSARPSPPQGIGAKIWIPIVVIIIIAAGAAAVFFLDLSGEDDAEVEPEPIFELPTPSIIVTEPTPPDPNSFFKTGKELLTQGYFNEAIDEFNQAIALGLDNMEVYLYRGDAYFEEGQYDLAIADYSTLIDIDFDSSVIYRKRGNAYAKIDDYEMAISDDTKVIELNPNDADAYFNRGLHYFSSIKVMDPSTYNSGHAKSALTDLDTAIALDSSNAIYYYSRGLVHNLYRLYDLAITDFTQAITVDPTYSDAYWERGILYLNMEQYKLATEDFGNMIELGTESMDPYYNRGHAYHLLGLYDLAIADFNIVLEQDATVEVQSERGFCYMEKGDLTKAILDFDMCTIYYPAFPDAWLGRARAYHLLGDNTKAFADLERYISLVRDDSALVRQARQMMEDWKE